MLVIDLKKSLIKTQLTGLNIDMQSMSKDEIKNQNLPALIEGVEEILIFLEKIDMAELESEEEAEQRQRGQGLKIMIPSQLITRLPILLLQVKAGNNSNKLKNEMRQIIYSLYRSKNLSKIIYNHLIKSIL